MLSPCVAEATHNLRIAMSEYSRHGHRTVVRNTAAAPRSLAFSEPSVNSNSSRAAFRPASRDMWRQLLRQVGEPDAQGLLEGGFEREEFQAGEALGVGPGNFAVAADGNRLLRQAEFELQFVAPFERHIALQRHS